MNTNTKHIAVVVALALILAVIVGVVFSAVEQIDDYTGVAALVTFLVVLLAGLTRDR